MGLDPRDHLLAQLEGGAPDRPTPPQADDATVGGAFRAFRTALTTRRAGAKSGADVEGPQREARRALVQVASAEAASALSLRVVSQRPFVERLVAFWGDHLCVSAAGKFTVGPLAGRYERDVIRRHVLGRFEDMVVASARHPAMLFYLDNVQSMGPRSRTVTRLERFQRYRSDAEAAAPRGLNENYARELLELHTLGVDGGYTQDDVTALARLLTGWSVTPFQRADVPGFTFAEGRHEPGEKRVLGMSYGDGEAEGERAIRALCRHPATARHVATKLARHFVADEPPPDAVARLAGVFTRTDGDLRALARALVDEPGAWDAGYRKFRTPQDWLVAAFRHLGLDAVPVQGVGALRQLRHAMWSPRSPAGFGDLERDWADPDGLLNRAELARTLVQRVAPGSGDALALAIAGPGFQWR